MGRSVGSRNKPKSVAHKPYAARDRSGGTSTDMELLAGCPPTLEAYLRANPPREPEPSRLPNRTNL
jgi:hypothetical protein